MNVPPKKRGRHPREAHHPQPTSDNSNTEVRRTRRSTKSTTSRDSKDEEDNNHAEDDDDEAVDPDGDTDTENVNNDSDDDEDVLEVDEQDEETPEDAAERETREWREAEIRVTGELARTLRVTYPGQSGHLNSRERCQAVASLAEDVEKILLSYFFIAAFESNKHLQVYR